MIQSQPGLQLRTGQGKRQVLREHLKTSGESEIWRTREPGQLAKLYHADKSNKAREQKLQVMLTIKPSAAAQDGMVWPREILNDAQGRFAGYLMPEVTQAYPLRRLLTEQSRQVHGLRFNLRQRLQLCLQLSDLMEQAHALGLVLADLKPENLLVQEKHGERQVFLIDLDSCQLRRGSRVWRCEVRSNDYAPPELLVTRWQEIEQLPGHDSFRLALLCFEILTDRHPFQGKPRDGSPPPLRDTNIRAGEWIGRKGGKLRPDAHYVADALPPALDALFRQAFERTVSQRPSPADFSRELQAALSQLRPCLDHPEHWYGRHLARCCWCPPKTLNLKPAASRQPALVPQMTAASRQPVRQSPAYSPSLSLAGSFFQQLAELPGYGQAIAERLAEGLCKQIKAQPWATRAAAFALNLPLIMLVCRWLSVPDHGLWLDLYFAHGGPALAQQFTFEQTFYSCFSTLTAWIHWIPTSYWWVAGLVVLLLSAGSEGVIGAVALIAALGLLLLHGLLAALGAGVWWLVHHFVALLGFAGTHLVLAADRPLHSLLGQISALPLREQALACPALGWMLLTALMLPLLLPLAWGLGCWMDSRQP